MTRNRNRFRKNYRGALWVRALIAIVLAIVIFVATQGRYQFYPVGSIILLIALIKGLVTKK